MIRANWQIGRNQYGNETRKFALVFPHTSVWFMNTLATDFLIVVGTPQELKIDMRSLAVRMAAPPVKADLESIHLADPWRLMNTLLVSGQQLRDYLGGGPSNTDDLPILSYSTYGAGLRQTVARNLTGLLAHRTATRVHNENVCVPGCAGIEGYLLPVGRPARRSRYGIEMSELDGITAVSVAHPNFVGAGASRFKDDFVAVG